MPSYGSCNCPECARYRRQDEARLASAETETEVCAWCSIRFDVGTGYNNGWGEDWCSSACHDTDTADIEDDDEAVRGAPLVHSYSYTPDLNFLKVAGEAEALFLGFELEVPTSSYQELSQAVYDSAGQAEEVLYCKEDGSIDGVEIVSHPMTHAYLRESFDFSMLSRTSDAGQYLRGTPGDGYGLHVHVSRKGFRNEAHALRWLLLIYRNESLVECVARRSSEQWAGFKDSEACRRKAGMKPTKKEIAAHRANLVSNGYDDYDADFYTNRWVESANRYNGDRYVAVNANNEHTYEVRVFRSTWDETEFRAAVDFVHASVIYTRNLRAREALRGGLTAGAFVAWLQDKPEYASLVTYLAARLDTQAGAELSA